MPEDSENISFPLPQIVYTPFQQRAEALINLIDRLLDHWRACEADQRDAIWAEYERAWSELQSLIWSEKI